MAFINIFIFRNRSSIKNKHFSFYQRSSAVGINKNWLNVKKLIGGHHYFLFLFIPSFKIRDYHCAGQNIYVQFHTALLLHALKIFMKAKDFMMFFLYININWTFCVLFEISFHCEMVTLLLPIPIYLPSRSWLLEKQTTLALVVIPQGFFPLRFYRLILCQMIPIQLLAAIMINFDWMKVASFPWIEIQ